MSKKHTLEGYLREIINIKEDIENGLIFEKLDALRNLIFSNYTEDVIVEKTSLPIPMLLSALDKVPVVGAEPSESV